MKISKTSIALLLIQLAIVSSVAAKYLYQRWTCPKVWTRAAAYDPELLMRGRYLSLQLTVDGCQSTMPSAKATVMPHYSDGAPMGKTFSIHAPQAVQFPADLKVRDNKLLAIRNESLEVGDRVDGLTVEALPGASCQAMRLKDPVDFYIAEHAADPTRLKPGQELWTELSVPPKGPPRPVQLALRDNGAWKPLAFQ